MSIFKDSRDERFTSSLSIQIICLSRSSFSCCTDLLNVIHTLRATLAHIKEQTHASKNTHRHNDRRAWTQAGLSCGLRAFSVLGQRL